MTRAPWVSEYIGIPHRELGRTRAEGLDCYGLLVVVYQEQLGISIESFETVGNSAVGEDLVRDIWQAARESDWRRIPNEEAQPGDALDFVIFNVPHCGVVAGPGEFLHTRGESGCHVARFDRGFYCNRLNGIYRHREK